MAKSTTAAAPAATAAADETQPEAAPPAPAAGPAAPVLSLDEACARMSDPGFRRASGRRAGVALLAAFNAHEAAAGRTHDTARGFAERLEAFAAAPAAPPSA